ncbi:MAG: winged helix-turn-helix transcriptional regulator [Thermoplasmata archaeon]
MDALDIRLLRTMGIQPFVYGARGPDALKPSRIADSLNVSVKTAKARLARLEEEGVIAGYQIYPNLHHLGVYWRSYFFRVPSEKKKGLSPVLVAVEGLVHVFDFFGPDLCIDLCYRDEPELARRLLLVSELLGATQAFDWYDNRMPPVTGTLSTLDWRIVKALRLRARTSLKDLSRDIGVTDRTIRRRLDRMVKGGGIDVVPLVDPTRMKDTVPAAFLFRLDEDQAQTAVREIEHVFDEAYLSAWVPPSPEMGHLITLLVARRMVDLDEMRRRAGTLPGVESVEAFIPADVWHNEDWIDEAIDRQTGQSKSAS